MSDPTPSEQRAANESLGELLSEVTGDISTLMRQEVALAKAELTESAKNAGRGAALYGGAGYAGHLTILFLSIALWWGLGHLVGNGWSALIVAVLWGIVAAILFVTGRKQMKKIEGAPRTVDSLKHLPDAVKRNEENR